MPFLIPPEVVAAGGWVFASGILTGVLLMIVKGDLVPGPTHKREVSRADRATDQLEREGDTNREVLAATKALTETLGAVLTLRPRRGRD